jgi:hypothetical protein
LSDIAAGALIGITSAKLVSGKWQVFGLRPPDVLAASQTTIVSWTIAF